MSSDNQLNYGLDMDTIDIADSVIIDVATKTLSTRFHGVAIFKQSMSVTSLSRYLRSLYLLLIIQRQSRLSI